MEDHAGIAQLVEMYASMIYRIAYTRMQNVADAEDITQEVLLKYLKADKTFRDEEHRKMWLIRVTVNTIRLCMVYVAAHVGFSGAVLNPFTIGIAQGLSDLPLFSGFEYRMFCWVVLTVLLIACVLRYASVIKRNPEKSPMYRADAYWRKRGEGMSEQIAYATTRSAYIVYVLVLMALVVFSVCYPQSTFVLGESSVSWYAVPFLTVLYAVFGWLGLRKSNHFFILVLLAFTILYLIVGVMGHGWYLPEISAIFLAMGILSGFANSEQTDTIIKQFLDGAKDMLSAAIVVGLAGGIIQILQDGRIIDPILHSLASLMGEAGRFVSLGARKSVV